MAVDLEAVRARVAALGLFNTVMDVAAAAQAMETSARPPAGFVGIASETAQPNRTQGVHDQTVEAMLSVLGVIAAQRKDDGQADAVEAIRLPLIMGMVGWVPPGARKALDYVGYRIVNMSNGLIWFEVTFRTGWHLRL